MFFVLKSLYTVGLVKEWLTLLLKLCLCAWTTDDQTKQLMIKLFQSECCVRFELSWLLVFSCKISKPWDRAYKNCVIPYICRYCWRSLSNKKWWNRLSTKRCNRFNLYGKCTLLVSVKFLYELRSINISHQCRRSLQSTVFLIRWQLPRSKLICYSVCHYFRLLYITHELHCKPFE